MDKKYKVQGAYFVPNTPQYEAFAKAVAKHPSAWTAAGGVYLPSEKEVTEQNYIRARRANPLNKFGAKDRMETQDYGYDKETMANLLGAYKTAAAKHNLPMLHPDELANLALVEGRSNFGYNEYNTNNKRAVKIAQDLQKQGFDPYAAGFPAAILDKQMTAQRLNVPFYQVWNGAGPRAQEYAKKIEEHRYAVEDPRNQGLRDFIRQTIGYKEPPAQVAMTEPEFNRGGSVRMPDTYSSGSWKLI
jgi:hypothetical protein